MENSELKEQSRHSFRLWAEFRAFMRDRFSLEDDKASQDEVAANISKGTEFRGVNLWVLICATMVASLGLNVNSAAVIIGHVYFSDHGADYGYRLFARDQRFRPAEKIRQELRPDVRRGDFDFDPLLFHLPAGECEQ